MISVGEHTARIATVEQTQSKAGNDMLKITMEVTVGEEAEPLWEYVVLKDSMEWKHDQVRKSVGLSADDRLTVDALTGRYVQVEVVHEEYNEKTSPKVKKWVGPSSERFLPVQEEQEQEEDTDDTIIPI